MFASNTPTLIVLNDFSKWLQEEYLGCEISRDLLRHAEQRFLKERIKGENRERRRDFVSRLMVCGFAHLLAPAGKIALRGQIARGFIPIFVQAFSSLEGKHAGKDDQELARKLIDSAEAADLAEADVWKYLLLDDALRTDFIRLLAEIVASTCASAELMDKAYEAIVKATPHGVTGLYEREDIFLIFAAWLSFTKRLLQASEISGIGTCSVPQLTSSDCAEALRVIDREIIETYQDVASFYLEDIEACLANAFRDRANQ